MCFFIGLDNVMNYYATDPTQEEIEIASNFISQTGINTDITIPYVFKGSDALLKKMDDSFYKSHVCLYLK